MESTSRSPIEGLRVLVVEDELLIGLDLQHQFESLGASVVGPVPSVSSALRALATDTQIDCATLDVSVGQEPVFPVADKLRERNLAFVFVTAFSRLVLPNEYRDTPCCCKPADPRQIADALCASCGDE